jgi:hypothetical protein
MGLSTLYTLQEPSYLGKIAMVLVWFRMMMTHIIARVYKDSLTFTYPPIINIWLLLWFWYPWVESLILLLVLIIHTHAFTYIPVRSNIGQFPLPSKQGAAGIDWWLFGIPLTRSLGPLGNTLNLLRAHILVETMPRAQAFLFCALSRTNWKFFVS